MTVIEAENIWKQFRRPHVRAHTLKEAAFAFLRGQTGYEEFWALKDISLSVARGESIGLIGPNGSGKSTLFALIARVLEPTRGELEVKGRVCPLLELGTGFHPDLSGRENVFLNASLLGMPQRRVVHIYDDIVEFAELADFMDAPVKTYSTGMVIRLGFSVAVHMEPEILLIDEVLSVGDEHFQHKSFERLLQFKQEGTAIFVISHDHIASVQPDGAVAQLLHGGQIVGDNEDGCALLLELQQPFEGLVLEVLVPHAEHLVDQQDLGLHVDRNRETQPDHHAGGVGLHRGIHEVRQLGELDDLIIDTCHSPLRHAEQAGIQKDILAAA